MVGSAGFAPARSYSPDSRSAASSSSATSRVKLVEPVGNAPTSSCLQGKCITCLPRPQQKLDARRLRQRTGSVIALPAHAISTKNKHLLLSCDTNPRFHGGSFGVLGHTSCEALKM